MVPSNGALTLAVLGVSWLCVLEVGSLQVTFKMGKLVRRKSLLYVIISVYCQLAFTNDLKPNAKGPSKLGKYE